MYKVFGRLLRGDCTITFDDAQLVDLQENAPHVLLAYLDSNPNNTFQCSEELSSLRKKTWQARLEWLLAQPIDMGDVLYLVAWHKPKPKLKQQSVLEEAVKLPLSVKIAPNKIKKLPLKMPTDIKHYIKYRLEDIKRAAQQVTFSNNDVLQPGVVWQDVATLQGIAKKDWQNIEVKCPAVADALVWKQRIDKMFLLEEKRLNLIRILNELSSFSERKEFLEVVVGEKLQANDLPVSRRRVEAEVLTLMLADAQGSPVFLKGWGNAFSKEYKKVEGEKDAYTPIFTEQLRKISELIDKEGYQAESLSALKESLPSISQISVQTFMEALEEGKALPDIVSEAGCEEALKDKYCVDFCGLSRAIETMLKSVNRGVYGLVYLFFNNDRFEDAVLQVDPKVYQSKPNVDIKSRLKKIWLNKLNREVHSRLRLYWGLLLSGTILFLWCLVIDSIGMFLSIPLLLLSVHECGAARATELLHKSQFSVSTVNNGPEGSNAVPVVPKVD